MLIFHVSVGSNGKIMSVHGPCWAGERCLGLSENRWWREGRGVTWRGSGTPEGFCGRGEG